MSNRVRPVQLLGLPPDHSDLGRTVAIGAGLTSPAYNIVQVNASQQAVNIPTLPETRLAYITEPATDPFFHAAGPGNSQTKSEVSVGFLRGVRIGITLAGTWAPALVGQARPLALDATTGFVTIQQTAGTAPQNVATIIRAHPDHQTISATATNVYVEAILSDAACYTGV